MGAIDEYGPIIHEFDPYFNYRATVYLYQNGWKAFATWFDYMSWYPLGRPVGTTIYPGMQVTAVFLKHYLLPSWSLNDICCYIHTWFGAIASFVTGCIAYECTIPSNRYSNIVQWIMDVWYGKVTEYTPAMTKDTPTTSSSTRVAGVLYSPATECGIATMGIMAVVPAHLMRSIGGGYDNEAIAMTAMCTTFYIWTRALRADDPYSYYYGILTGIAYFYMVAAWGGYIFVLNMIGLHAAVLVLCGRFRFKIWAAYSLFYMTGTVLSIQVPVVGWSPLKSLEQLGPCAVFLAYQILMITEQIRIRRNLSRIQAWELRYRTAVGGTCLLVALIVLLVPQGYFGPISARVRGLFVQHTKTGNPLVDSVAEHQAASPKAYFQYLHNICLIAPMGFVTIFWNLSDSSSFLICWALMAYFFSHKMVRLVLLTGPIASVLGGIVVGRLFAWGVHVWWNDVDSTGTVTASTSTTPTSSDNASLDTTRSTGDTRGHSGKRRGRGGGGNYVTGKKGKVPIKRSTKTSSFDGLLDLYESYERNMATKEGLYAKRFISLIYLIGGCIMGLNFVKYSWTMSRHLSNPTVVTKARTRDGQIVLVNDYLDAYIWLRDNTPEDARVMAWWDYGYQIAGIANRTTIADGNTWNHEHIALLGKALTADLDEGYEISRHWADYVLIWGGGGGDDLAKSPHLARIANSVYRDHCVDATCHAFGFIDRAGTPSPMMKRSFLYHLHSSGLREGVQAPPDKFEEVYRSKYGKVRIWKILGVSEESKAWVADPANRICDAPGSWFCRGQYPPGLNKVLASKTDFRQLEDFNRARGKEDNEEYTKEYFANLNDPAAARRRALERERELEKQRAAASAEQASSGPVTKLDRTQWEGQAQTLYKSLQDSEQATMLWEYIHNNQVDKIREWLEKEPWWAFVRSTDGRGPMWW
jgi:dolichyl-diphosphooligosaccharide--protein glycosyltransferase